MLTGLAVRINGGKTTRLQLLPQVQCPEHIPDIALSVTRDNCIESVECVVHVDSGTIIWNPLWKRDAGFQRQPHEIAQLCRA